MCSGNTALSQRHSPFQAFVALCIVHDPLMGIRQHIYDTWAGHSPVTEAHGGKAGWCAHQTEGTSAEADLSPVPSPRVPQQRTHQSRQPAMKYNSVRHNSRPAFSVRTSQQSALKHIIMAYDLLDRLITHMAPKSDIMTISSSKHSFGPATIISFGNEAT